MTITINQTAIVYAASEPASAPLDVNWDGVRDPYGVSYHADQANELHRRAIDAEYQLMLTRNALARALESRPLKVLDVEPAPRISWMQRIGQALMLSAPKQEKENA